jgi:hypothetical protein
VCRLRRGGCVGYATAAASCVAYDAARASRGENEQWQPRSALEQINSVIAVSSATLRTFTRNADSIARKLEDSSVVTQVYGSNRWDGFYLLPVHVQREHGALLVDFAINRAGQATGLFQGHSSKAMRIAARLPRRAASPAAAL